LSGYGGWKLLQATYDRQLQIHSESGQVKADRAYLKAKLAEPITKEAFLDDKRLMRVALTAFDLGGEEWKRGFIDKVLKEAADPESTFLPRLNNPKYSAFAAAFAPVNDVITISPEVLQKIADDFDSSSFESAVGQVDDSMRLALNYQSDIQSLIGSGSSDKAILYRLLGSVPVRTVLETATGLPTSIRKLPIETQAGMLKEALQKRFGISDLQALASSGQVEKVIGSYHSIRSISEGPSGFSPASNALTLLNGGAGLGGQGGINLLLSGL
jgi:hypothetical protein